MARVPTVSVVIPTYQRRGLVQDAVRSVLAQTYGDFELIVVDDGSADGTGEALAALGCDLRYHWQPNRGLAAARNAGVALARGQIVSFLDSDDLWLPDHLAAVTETFARQPRAVLVSTTPRHRAEGSATADEAVLLDPLPACWYGNPVGWPSSISVRRADFMAVGGFDEQLWVGEGAEMWARLAFRGPFALLERRTIEKRRTAGCLVESWRDSGAFLDAFELTAWRGAKRLDALSGTAAERLRTCAAGAVEFIAALRALVRGEERSMVVALENACRLLPQLSRDAESLDHRLRLLPFAGDTDVHRNRIETLASVWPDPRSRTAAWLGERMVHSRGLDAYVRELV
jgi:glycosyltransferase involved in cell wall biosynthesis